MTDTSVPRTRSLGALVLVKDLLVGSALCLTPVTAILALGWLTRMMERTTRHAWMRPTEPVGWIMGPQGYGLMVRLFGGLGANIRMGLRTVLGLFFYTIPFTALWLLSWWAGWDNSFNKGYEQAWIGPSLGLTGVAIAILALTHLPYALAHFAVQGRFIALFEVRRIRMVFSRTGWRSVGIAALTVLLALPFFALRSLPVFVENIIPGFEALPPEDISTIIMGLTLAGAVWCFASLYILRFLAARLYARAAAHAARSPDHHALWHNAEAMGARTGHKRTRKILRPVWFILTAVIWLGLIAQIFVGQFMNYDPLLWITHPYFLLPWFG
jgi:hypothetical protein